jgi:hypothetical protein
MTTRKERLEKAKRMLSWSDGSEGDELEDEEEDLKVEKFNQTIENMEDFFKAKQQPENRITPKYLKVKLEKIEFVNNIFNVSSISV